MIHDQDRSGWIGASDTAMVIGSWSTKSFAQWWLVKLGLRREQFTTPAMLAGTFYEHPILQYIGVDRMDRQIRNRSLRLRVNLDGETRSTIKEVKTYGGETFKISRAYWAQAQVEMFAAHKALDLIAYRLDMEDYRNFFRPIDPARLSIHSIEYDPDWIKERYLPRLSYLALCLKKGWWPNDTHI